jgi:uncharacterized repeat protein (TIGR04076 family)
MIKIEPDHKVKIQVTYSDCPFITKNATYYLSGPLYESSKSDDMCITALLAIYPWIMAARFGIESENLEWNDGYTVWCPEKQVEFTITYL